MNSSDMTFVSSRLLRTEVVRVLPFNVPCQMHWLCADLVRSEHVISQLDHAVVESLLVLQDQIESVIRQEPQSATDDDGAQKHVDPVDKTVPNRVCGHSPLLHHHFPSRFSLYLRMLFRVEPCAQLRTRCLDCLKCA